jgi:FKBP-type peptidyl-prolyl cis-trans isomerase
MSKLEEFKKKKAAQLRAANEQFLSNFTLKQGVVALGNGLAYEVIEEGHGKAHPSVKDWITIHYEGQLTNGKVFDSSLGKSKPPTFKLNNLIEAWQRVVPLMVAGDKWRIVVPPAMGYGERPSGNIPGNSILIFEIELISIGR